MKKFLLFTLIGIFVIFGVMGVIHLTSLGSNVVMASTRLTIFYSNGQGIMIPQELPLFTENEGDTPATLNTNRRHVRAIRESDFTEQFNRPGFRFLHWVDTGDNNREIQAGERLPAGWTEGNSSGRILEARWEAINYTINLNIGRTDVTLPSGSVSAFQMQVGHVFGSAGQILPQLPSPNPNPGNVQFLGWEVQINATTRIQVANGDLFRAEFLPAVTNSTLTIFARWSDAQITQVRATFNLNGGTWARENHMDVNPGTVPNPGVNPTRANHTFTGWSPALQAISVATTFTAQWTPTTVNPPPTQEQARTITFLPGEGTWVAGALTTLPGVLSTNAATFGFPGIMRAGATAVEWRLGSTRINNIPHILTLTNDLFITITPFFHFPPAAESRTIDFTTDSGTFSNGTRNLTLTNVTSTSGHTFPHVSGVSQQPQWRLNSTIVSSIAHALTLTTVSRFTLVAQHASVVNPPSQVQRTITFNPNVTQGGRFTGTNAGRTTVVINSVTTANANTHSFPGVTSNGATAVEWQLNGTRVNSIAHALTLTSATSFTLLAVYHFPAMTYRIVLNANGGTWLGGAVTSFNIGRNQQLTSTQLIARGISPNWSNDTSRLVHPQGRDRIAWTARAHPAGTTNASARVTVGGTVDWMLRNGWSVANGNVTVSGNVTTLTIHALWR